MEFDLQRFEDEESTSEESAAQVDESAEEIPEELGGLPEEYARAVMVEATSGEQSPPESQPQQPQPAEDKVSRADYQTKVNEVEHLKAQLAQYQQAQQQREIRQQQQQPQPEHFKITPEVATQINQAIRAEAMTLSGMSDDDVASLDYADDDDPRLSQWAQAKSIAQTRVYSALQQMQTARFQQAQQFLADHRAAVQTYNDFAQKEFAEPDFQQIKDYATNEYFNNLPENEKRIVANAYLRVEHQLASPAEMLCVKNYYENAKLAYRSRDARKNKAPRQPATTTTLPRVDQLRGTTTADDGQLSARDFEELLKGDFTKLDEKTQKKLLGYT